MRILTVYLSMLAFACIGLADQPPPFAVEGRFVSVVQYSGGTGPHWTVWAVAPSLLTIYTQSGTMGKPDRLLAEIKISRQQETKIRQTAATLRRSAKGRAWYSPDVLDGSALSVYFSANGNSRYDDIALENVWRTELADLCIRISEISPTDLKITYASIIESDPYKNKRFPVVSIPVKDYYNQ